MVCLETLYMNHFFSVTGSVFLGVLLFVGCNKNEADVEDSPSAATNIRKMEAAARKGDASEMIGLGMTYYRGSEDVPEDPQAAYVWLKLAAEDEDFKDATDLQQALEDLEKKLRSIPGRPVCQKTSGSWPLTVGLQKNIAET